MRRLDDDNLAARQHQACLHVCDDVQQLSASILPHLLYQIININADQHLFTGYNPMAQ